MSISEQIIGGEFTMVPSKWRHVSDQGTAADVQPEVDAISPQLCVAAKDVVRKLLVVDPSRRMSIDQALEHPWLQVRRPAPTARGSLTSLTSLTSTVHV